MGFVKSPQEIRAIQARLANPVFRAEGRLTVAFLSTRDAVRTLLPPGLEPADEPLMAASVGRFRSNCVGDFEGGAISIAARHGKLEAYYVLAMWMSTDRAVVFGRELFGEPKKQAHFGLARSGASALGIVERDGVRLLQIQANLTQDLGAGQEESATFNIKALPASDGNGLEADAVLTHAAFENNLTSRLAGTAELTLKGTPFDPLDEIPVAEVRRAVYVEGELSSRARSIATIPAKAFLPYALGRMDDWSRLDTLAGAREAAAE